MRGGTRWPRSRRTSGGRRRRSPSVSTSCSPNNRGSTSRRSRRSGKPRALRGAARSGDVLRERHRVRRPARTPSSRRLRVERRAPRDALAAQDVEGNGHTLGPGLIDCHVHLSFDGSADFSGEAQGLTEARAAIKAIRNAARHLASGVTTVRDLGGVGASMCDVARAIDEGIVAGTRVRPAGQALTVTGGHGHGLFALEVDGADGLRKAVRQQVSAGAKAIKVVATGGVLTPGIKVDVTAFTLEELEAAVDEAHKWDLPIAAHAHGAAGIANAVRAGVDSIEHGSQISAQVAKEM
ncbi:MAG: hypothetical protein E6G39_06565, partial [Actinobacteria bacterium]